MGTLPYLQLPGWTVATVYFIIVGLFGQYLPVISTVQTAMSRVASQHRVTKALHDFSNWIVHRSMDGLTNRVYQGINYFTFRNRNRNRIRNRNDHRRKPIKQHKPKLMAYDEDYYMDYVENYENYGYDY